MKVLLVGVGTVGEAIVRLSAGRPWLEQMVLAGRDLDHVREISDTVGDASSHPVEELDASDEAAMELLAEGVGQGSGVLSVESFDPDPCLAILDRDGIHHATIDVEPGSAFA